jgi:hypothetical protein
MLSILMFIHNQNDEYGMWIKEHVHKQRHVTICDLANEEAFFFGQQKVILLSKENAISSYAILLLISHTELWILSNTYPFFS